MKLFQERFNEMMFFVFLALSFYFINEKVNRIENDVACVKEFFTSKNIMLIEIGIEGQK